jgi:hypothetical protein
VAFEAAAAGRKALSEMDDGTEKSHARQMSFTFLVLLFPKRLQLLHAYYM